MKRLLTILLLVVAIATCANAQLNNIYKKCQDQENVSTIKISKTMLRLAGAFAPTDSDAEGIAAKKLDNVLIVTSDNSKGAKFIGDYRKEFSESNGYEALMELKDDGDNIVIYYKELSKNKNEFILSIIENSSATMIVMDGSLTLEDVAKFAESNK